MCRHGQVSGRRSGGPPPRQMSALRADSCGGTSLRTSDGEGGARPVAADNAAGRPRQTSPRADGRAGVSPGASGKEGRGGAEARRCGDQRPARTATEGCRCRARGRATAIVFPARMAVRVCHLDKRRGEAVEAAAGWQRYVTAGKRRGRGVDMAAGRPRSGRATRKEGGADACCCGDQRSAQTGAIGCVRGGCRTTAAIVAPHGRPRGYVTTDKRWGGAVDAAAGRPRRLAPRTDGRAGVSPWMSGEEEVRGGRGRRCRDKRTARTATGRCSYVGCGAAAAIVAPHGRL